MGPYARPLVKSKGSIFRLWRDIYALRAYGPTDRCARFRKFGVYSADNPDGCVNKGCKGGKRGTMLPYPDVEGLCKYRDNDGRPLMLKDLLTGKISMQWKSTSLHNHISFLFPLRGNR